MGGLCLTGIEEDRGQCECFSSQEVTKVVTMRPWPVSYQLTGVGRREESTSFFHGHCTVRPSLILYHRVLYIQSGNGHFLVYIPS